MLYRSVTGKVPSFRGSFVPFALHDVMSEFLYFVELIQISNSYNQASTLNAKHTMCLYHLINKNSRSQKMFNSWITCYVMLKGMYKPTKNGII